MSRNTFILVAIALFLGVIYAWFFSDWFHKEAIEIIPTVRAGRASSIPRLANMPPVYPVSFMLNGRWRLTTLKVVEAEDLATNKYPLALWHMISDSNSVPVKHFQYGDRIRGMKPAERNARPRPLWPDVKYVLMLEAEGGKYKGQTNFFTREAKGPGVK